MQGAAPGEPHSARGVCEFGLRSGQDLLRAVGDVEPPLGLSAAGKPGMRPLSGIGSDCRGP